MRKEAAGEIDEGETLSVVVHSTTTPQPANHGHVEKGNESIKQWLNHIMESGGRGGVSDSTNYKASASLPIFSSSQTIHRVPQMLKQMEHSTSEKCFEPVVVTIGPYHCKLIFESANRFKKALTYQYVKHAISKTQLHQESSKNTMGYTKISTIHEAFEKVKRVADDARKCYDAEDPSLKDLDDVEFSKMMFLDGCFILQYIDSTVNNKPNELKSMMSHEIAFVKRDLFLLENQLPYKVLKALMEIRFEKDHGYEMIQKFINQTRATPPQEESFVDKVIREILPHTQQPPPQKIEPRHLLDFMWKELVDESEFKNKYLNTLNAKKKKKGHDWHSYRSAHDLRNAGIHFKLSETPRFTDIRYENQLYRGVLKLPAMTIDDSTKSVLLNLVAYELTKGLKPGVSSYLSFMDLLIDNEQDVKALRKKRIILNYVSTDEQVAKLFNEIAKDLVPNPDAYAEVKERIEWHHRNKVYLWANDWIQTHFSSPWTVLAFLGALLALGCSLAQTYYAAKDKDPKIIVV